MKEQTKNKIITAIKDRTKDSRDQVKMQALRALSLFEESKDAPVSDLVSMVIDGDKLQRMSAVQALCAVGEKAVDEVIERLVNNEDDYDARTQGITILTEILAAEQQKPKDKQQCNHDHDPYGLGPIVRNALKKVLKEAFEEINKETK